MARSTYLRERVGVPPTGIPAEPNSNIVLIIGRLNVKKNQHHTDAALTDFFICSVSPILGIHMAGKTLLGV